MPRKRIEILRYDVIVWKDGASFEEEKRAVYKDALELANKKWRQHRGALEVTIYDTRTNGTKLRLEPGPMPMVYGLPCNDPEYTPPSPWGDKRRRG